MQGGRDILRGPFEKKQTQIFSNGLMPKRRMGLTQNKINQTQLNGKRCGPSSFDFNRNKAHSGEHLEAHFLVKGQQRGKTIGMEEFRSNGLTENRPVLGWAQDLQKEKPSDLRDMVSLPKANFVFCFDFSNSPVSGGTKDYLVKRAQSSEKMEAHYLNKEWALKAKSDPGPLSLKWT